MFINNRTIRTIFACCTASRIVSIAAKTMGVLKEINEYKLNMFSSKEKLTRFDLQTITK